MLANDNFWLHIKKLHFVAGILFVMWLFGDLILLFMGYCLHLTFELIATIVEHWLQSVFRLTERQAQITFFYLFTFSSGCLGWWLSKKIYYKFCMFCHKAHCHLCLILNEINWFKVMAFMAFFSSSVLLLT